MNFICCKIKWKLTLQLPTLHFTYIFFKYICWNVCYICGMLRHLKKKVNLGSSKSRVVISSNLYFTPWTYLWLFVLLPLSFSLLNQGSQKGICLKGNLGSESVQCDFIYYKFGTIKNKKHGLFNSPNLSL